jgi:hypothetical protein
MSATAPDGNAAQAEATPGDFNPWVTGTSRFLDPIWTFERWNRARTTCNLRINWRQPLGDGAVLTDPRYAALLQVGRELVYLLMITPPSGRRRHRAGSAIDVAGHILAFFRWVVANGFIRLGDVDAETVARYRLVVLARRTRKGRPLAANTTARYLNVLLDLHLLRGRLSDGLHEHPFQGMELDEILGGQAATGEIAHIPMDIAVPFLLVAVRWVREQGPEIAAVLERCEEAYSDQAARGGRQDGSEASLRALRNFRFTHPAAMRGQPFGEFLKDRWELWRLVRFSITAGFIVVAALTGMRLSELLSLEEDCLERERLDDGSGDSLLYVRGILLKTAGTPSGDSERWVAGIDGPDNHVRAAVELVRRLTAELRRRSDGRQLFLRGALHAGRRPDSPGGITITGWLNTFARAIGTARPWRFSSHQFRKTFARFVALGDKSGLLALKQHFKHVSIAMTDRYVGRDLELVDLVETEKQEELGHALDELLGTDCLAGKLGDQIIARNQRFRGRAGEQVRREYVKMVLEETDLVILPHEYGYCVYRAEVARCGGAWARVGLSTCIGCSNFTIGPSHQSFWERRRDDAARLNADLGKLPGRETAVSATREMIVEAETVLARIRGTGSGA